MCRTKRQFFWLERVENILSLIVIYTLQRNKLNIYIYIYIYILNHNLAKFVCFRWSPPSLLTSYFSCGVFFSWRETFSFPCIEISSRISSLEFYYFREIYFFYVFTIIHVINYIYSKKYINKVIKMLLV